ncbi:phosphate transport system substrate-binding protein [Vreelandella songnenensis]|uniref:Phosphate transport system substrate-binding protein n=1 Tax=Vreelandella songnenensis TaxID=1176243 RepID=A0A2T0V452_9GAMM|nr:phosphate ABC transporter substrate-binding protein [Halomonas songnenensis]PRY64838.1 phosphate transport system substrate-binding protein [Halomonas songnenensis]
MKRIDLSRNRGCRLRAVLVVALMLCASMAFGQPQPISGTLSAIGSDTMAGLTLRWAEALTNRYPGISVQFQATGSASVPPALTAGTTRLGPMSRPMSAEERQAFIDRYGYPPLALRVAKDALVLVVHRHNPLNAITRQQADAIFSTDQACGAPSPIRRWSELPATHDWSYGHIALHGRNLASGTHGLFQAEVLCGGRFRPDISEHPGSSAVVAAVGESPNAMGYAGYNHLTPMVHALRLITQDGTEIAPTEQTIQRNEYPLARNLYLYVNLPPGESLPPADQAFLALILSEEGQQIARAAGFVPLPESELITQRAW